MQTEWHNFPTINFKKNQDSSSDSDEYNETMELEIYKRNVLDKHARSSDHSESKFMFKK